jgi:endonuclease-3
MKPSDIPYVARVLREEFGKRNAPIVDLIATQTQDPFCILLATMLSTRTKDETTAQACERLFRVVRQPHDLDRLSVRDIEKLIFPVGFYRTKARHLKELPAVLDLHSGGRVPDTIEDLMKLSGVGRKVANLVLSQAFDQHAICVDVHVHRISNRLGLIQTRDPYQTELALQRVLPRRHWKTWNSYLVSFGQTVCRPVGPRCGVCPINRWCRRIGVAAHRSPKPQSGAKSRLTRAGRGIARET